MIYENIITGIFIKRINRFIAEVSIDGTVHKVHVKNTGRCKELFIEGVTVFLEPAKNPDRKTKFSLIGIIKGNLMINIDSQVPNAVAFEGIQKGLLSHILGDVQLLKREVTYGSSRFDLYYETAKDKGFIEVKGVTLEDNGVAMFPDAPTTRGAKHVRELIESQKEGYKSYILFIIQMKPIKYFRPYWENDMNFAQTLALAKENGVGIICYDCVVTEDSIVMDGEIECSLDI